METYFNAKRTNRRPWCSSMKPQTNEVKPMAKTPVV